MSHHPAWLNQRNKELAERVDNLQAELQRHQATIRLESEVLKGTSVQLVAVRQREKTYADLVDKKLTTVREEEGKATLAAKEAEGVQRSLQQIQAEGKAWTDKLLAVAAQVDGKRAAVQQAEVLAADEEQRILSAFANNRIAAVNNKEAQEALAAQEAKLSKLKNEAERLGAALRRCQADTDVETMIIDQLMQEKNAAKDTRNENVREAQALRTQLEAMRERQDQTGAIESDLAAQKRELEAMILARKKEQSEVTKDRQATESMSKQLERTHQDVQRKIAAFNVELRALEESKTTAEAEVERLESAATFVAMQSKKLREQREYARQQLKEQMDRYEKTLVKLSSLSQTVAERIEDATDVQAVAAATEKMRTECEQEIEAQKSVMERGMQMLRMHVSAHQAVIEATEPLEKEVQWRRQALNKVHQSMLQLHQREEQLMKAGEEMDAAIAAAQRRVKEAEDELHPQFSLDQRKELRDRITDLETIQTSWSRRITESKDAVRTAQVELQAIEQENGKLMAAMDQLRADQVSMKQEIQQLGGDKERDRNEYSEKVQRLQQLHFRKEELKRQAEERAGEVVSNIQARQDMEAEAAMEMMVLDSQVNAAQLELGIVQQERHNVIRQYHAVKSQETMLQNRYHDLVASMELAVSASEGKMMADKKLQGSKEGPGVGPTGLLGMALPAGLAGALMDPNAEDYPPLFSDALIAMTGTNVTEMEQLQARFMLQKAMERQALQERGDKLDAAIVAAEKELQQLEAALSMIRSSGHPSSDGSMEVALYNAEDDAAMLDAVEQLAKKHVEAIMKKAGGVGLIGGEEDTSILASQLESWTFECQQLKQRHVLVQEGHELVKRHLAAEVEERDRLMVQLRAKMRDFDRAVHQTTHESVAAKKSSVALRGKVESVLSTRKGIDSVQRVLEREKVDALLRRAVQLAGSISERVPVLVTTPSASPADWNHPTLSTALMTPTELLQYRASVYGLDLPPSSDRTSTSTAGTAAAPARRTQSVSKGVPSLSFNWNGNRRPLDEVNSVALGNPRVVDHHGGRIASGRSASSAKSSSSHIKPSGSGLMVQGQARRL